MNYVNERTAAPSPNGDSAANDRTDRTEAPILELDDLHVAYRMGGSWVDVVHGISLEIRRGETFGLVGESGCGKSTTAFAIVDYLGRNGRITGGRVNFLGEDLRQKSPAELRSLRGQRISMVYQDPRSALNPALQIGRQISEIVRTHEGLDATSAWRRSVEMLERVHMPDPESVMRRYPHQLSGGMQQRVLIAMALITNPDLLIMDEPTTGLDVTTQATVLDLVNELKQEFDSAILYISHDLSVIARVCDRVGVMYAGELVETGTVAEIFRRTRHPYALDLIECVPRLDRHYRSGDALRTIPGRVPHPTQLPSGCIYAARCRFARERCVQEHPELTIYDMPDFPSMPHNPNHKARCFFSDEVEAEAVGRQRIDLVSDESSLVEAAPPAPPRDRKPLLEVRNLRKFYGQRRRKYLFFGPIQRRVKAVDGVSFHINEGETFSLVGESGCGKTTLGRTVVGLLKPNEGEIRFRDIDATQLAGDRSLELREAMQIVFQNPASTLNPRHKIGRIIGRTLRLFGVHDRGERRRRTIELLEAVRLDASYADRYPAQLSGGEKQRVAIARAFAGAPQLVVCDEAVSALDVSVQAAILNLLVDLKVAPQGAHENTAPQGAHENTAPQGAHENTAPQGAQDDNRQECAYLFISHDLSVVRYLSDRVGVMYLGQMMEIGTVEQVFAAPSHPYTEALLAAVEEPDILDDSDVQAADVRLQGSVPSPINPPTGCPFHTRCPRFLGDICVQETPPWRDAGDGHGIFCHIPLDELIELQTQEVAPEANQAVA